jgi:hypothetical protein
METVSFAGIHSQSVEEARPEARVCLVCLHVNASVKGGKGLGLDLNENSWLGEFKYS